MSGRKPSEINYIDSGCQLHPRCLECPEERCAEEEDPLSRACTLRKARVEQRQEELQVKELRRTVKGMLRRWYVMKMVGQGATSAEVARALGISKARVDQIRQGL